MLFQDHILNFRDFFTTFSFSYRYLSSNSGLFRAWKSKDEFQDFSWRGGTLLQILLFQIHWTIVTMTYVVRTDFILTATLYFKNSLIIFELIAANHLTHV